MHELPTGYLGKVYNSFRSPHHMVYMWFRKLNIPKCPIRPPMSWKGNCKPVFLAIILYVGLVVPDIIDQNTFAAPYD